MWRALAAIGAEVPDDVRVVVVRGEGSSFSAGLDKAMLDPAGSGDDPESVVGAAPARDDDEVAETIDRFQRASPGCATRGSSRSRSCRATRSVPASSWRWPVTSGCVGDDVRLCMKEPALGLVPDLTGTKPLVDDRWLRQSTGDLRHRPGVGAAEALAIGLATLVCPVPELDASLADLVGALTACGRGGPRDQGTAAWRRRAEHARGATAARARGPDPTVPRAGRVRRDHDHGLGDRHIRTERDGGADHVDDGRLRVAHPPLRPRHPGEPDRTPHPAPRDRVLQAPPQADRAVPGSARCSTPASSWCRRC